MKHQIFIILLLVSQTIAVLGQTSIIEQQPYAKIDSLLNAHFTTNKTGAAFAIIKNGKTTYKNVIGLANVEYNIPITDATTFNIASISKQFTTYLALLLEQEGKLSFNHDIRTYLPELIHLPSKITIKQLTNHTHGLANPDELARLKGFKTMNHQEVVKMLLNIKQVNYKAGEKYEYNNTGYILLSEIIERVGQKPFKKQLQEKIFIPLGMKDTKAVDNNDMVVNNKAYSYNLDNDMYASNPVQLATIGSSGIYTTINDLALWAKNYQNPVVGNSAFYEKMQAATILNSKKEINYGLGLQFDNYKGIDIIFHGGGTASYRSYILHAPKHKLSIIFLSNANNFSGLDIVYNSIDLLLKRNIKTKTPAKIAISNDQLKKHTGTYEFQPGVYYNIIAKKDTLYFQPFGTKDLHPLPHLYGNTFDFPYIPHTKFIFYEDKFDFRIADFIYECFKSGIKQPNSNEIELTNFIGTFRNKEHSIVYDLSIEEDKLILTRTFGNPIVLNVLTLESFYSPELGKLDFTYDLNKQITGFKLSGQNFKNIVFKK
ncbi:serine hydrolase [Aquimarina sp. AU474]|uniref:serine hydrolase domain-containing protein n=1 Tax=Aquimarina sp. AU474 TaxID=2108529 RepID=UPI0013570287|nr:serine hydrolase domain-containing protein [Aquimarina sp. AU474]